MPVISPLKRTALFVSDLDRSLAFYKGILEMTEWGSTELVDEVASLLIGRRQGRTRAVILQSDALPYGWVGLFEVKEPAPERLEKGRGAHIGETCLVFEAPDLDVITARLVEGGHDIICPPTVLRVPGHTTQREMTFYDPDRIMINVIERVQLRLPVYPA